MIDISNNNSRSWLPLQYNFRKAYESGQRRVYFKATEGSAFVDKRTPALAKRAKAAGLLVGWYHFANAWWQPPAKQAEFFVRNMPKGYDLLPCLDMEQGQPSTAKGAWALAFGLRVQELTGLDPIPIYGSTYYLDVCFSKYSQAARHPLWIAGVTREGGPLDFSHVRIPHPWTFDEVAFHQYDWHHRVPGIPGECDISRPVHAHMLDIVGV